MVKNIKINQFTLLALFLTTALISVSFKSWSSLPIESQNFINHKIALSGKVASTLQVRNPYGAKHSLESEHFVYWFDDKYLGHEELLAQELERMEYSWQQLIIARGFLPPLDEYKLNIYLEQAGSSTVPFEGYSGHAKIDDDGYPFIIMGAEILNFGLLDSRLHSTHELFHTIQYAYGDDYGIYRDQASWFGEASAGWAAIETWQMPEMNGNYIAFLASIAYVSIDTDKRKNSSSSSQTAINAHHYAMAMFLYFISEQTDAKLVKQVILALANDLDSQISLNALDKIATILSAEYGYSLADLASEFHSRNLLWDYSYGATLREKQAELGITQNSRVLFSTTEVNNQWQYMLEHNTVGLPMSTGGVYLHFSNSQITELEFSFQDESILPSNSSIDWQITLITANEESSDQDATYQEANYQEIIVQGGIVDKQLITLTGKGEFWLSITPILTPHQTYEQFPFSFQFANKGETTAYQPPPTPLNLGNDIITDQASGAGVINYGALLFLFIFLIRRVFIILRTNR